MTSRTGARISLYPARRAIALALAGGVAALVLGVAAPGLWMSGVAWVGLCGFLFLIDAGLSTGARTAALSVERPAALSINGQGQVTVVAAFQGRAPAEAAFALDMGPKLAVALPSVLAPVAGGVSRAVFEVAPVRRGEAALEGVWARWRGPLGLMWKQLEARPAFTVAVTPDIEGVKQAAVRLFAREARHGLKTQLEAGEGGEFHALKEFQVGMDARAIDWKQSARHGALLVKEHRTERNNPIVLAVDAGRSMCEPVDGLARVDWALNAALLLAYVSLRIGDRAALYSFAARPHRMVGPMSGVRAFAALQQAAAGVDYSTEETNFTFGLTALADRLERRSLVVVFTEFTDPTSAELMVESVGRLFARHLVVFVVLRDEELDGLMTAEPRAPQDVTRAVIAAALARERDLVIAHLRRLGVEIVDAPARRIGPALLDRYLDLKCRNRL